MIKIGIKESLIQSYKALAYFIILVFSIAIVVYSVSSYYHIQKKAREIEELRITLERSLSEWSAGLNEGVIDLSKVNSSTVPANITVSIYYANGTLAKSVSG